MSVIKGLFVTWPGRLVAVALVGVLAGGIVVASRVNGQPAKTDIRTQAVTRGAVTQTVAVSGSINPSTQVKLAFKTQGKIAAVYVSVGQQVAAGQAIATLDTTDLQNALTQAQQNLKSAQLSYDKAVQGAGDAQRSLDQTIQSTQTDIATAQQALAKLQANYANARGNVLTFGSAIYTDLGSFQSALDAIKTNIDIVLNQLDNSQRNGDIQLNAQNDFKSAQTSLNNSYAPLQNAQNLAATVLKPAIDDLQRSLDGIGAAIMEFDSALAASQDAGRATSDFQQAMLSYSLASSRLQGALDSVTAPLGTIATNVSMAQASLNTTNTRTIKGLDMARTYLAALQSSVASEQQQGSALKTRLTQAGSSLSTVSDAIVGGIVTALQNIVSAQQRAASSVQSAQTNVANQPFSIATAKTAVDNAALSVQNAQASIDAATLTAPAAGVIASIANAVGENSASPFAVLAGTSALSLHGTVGEADVAKLKLGQVANVTIDAVGTNNRMTGKVTSVDPVATIQQGVPVYGVDVTIDLPNQQVRPGMSGTANVVIASKQGVLIVPNLAIRSSGSRRYVQVLKDGEAVDADVTFGIANDTVTEVASGLAEGDLVVLPQARATGTQKPGGFGPGGGGGPVIVGPGRGG